MQISCDFAPFSAAIIGFIRMNEEIFYKKNAQYVLKHILQTFVSVGAVRFWLFSAKAVIL